MKALSLELTTFDPPGVATQAWRERNDGWMRSKRYVEQSVSADQIQYSRRYVPGICVLLAIFTFPIGLLALFVRSTATLVVSFSPRSEASTVVRLSGDASRQMRKELTSLAEAMNDTGAE